VDTHLGLGGIMRVGDLVHHAIHRNGWGIIMEIDDDCRHEVKVQWLNNNWGLEWTFDDFLVVISEGGV
jgi:hypothetical protein